MELIHSYMEDDALRHKLNDLTQKTFGFDFENWVKDGYFEGDYIPYSFLENGKVISNVSANRMRFTQNGVIKEYIQIGTVMTDPAFRNQGLAKKLMKHVMAQYEDCCEGIYLFSDPGALGFYQKLGFAEGLQYRYRLKGETARKEAVSPFLPVSPDGKSRYMDAVRQSAVNASLEQINKFGLQMFYMADLSDVYYAADIDCYAVMKAEKDTLLLQSIICRRHWPMKEILARMDVKYKNLFLGFAPCREDRSLFDAEVFDGGEDYRLFYRGKALESIEKEKLFFPVLSHA